MQTGTPTPQMIKWKQPNNPSSCSLVALKNIDLKSTTYQKWTDHRMDQICEQIDEWNLDSLWIGGNMYLGILGKLVQIRFPNLVRIDISNNCIQSLENFSRMQIPNLKQLYVHQNHLTSLKPLHRSDLPFLFFIGLSGNPIAQISQLSVADLPRLQWLGFDFQDSRIFIADIRWVVKTNSPVLNYVQLENRKRWNLKSLEMVFENKYITTRPELF